MGNHDWLIRITGKHRIEEAGTAIMEAFGWLERNGLISLVPYGLSSTMHHYQLTQSGRSLHTESDVDKYERRFACRKGILHKRIQNKSWDSFVSGDYATSVFAAFKEIEVAVREQGKLANSDIGQDLMKKAFRSGGKLVDASEPRGEQEALSMLFEGAVGRFRNPAAHRHVEVDSPEETFEMLAFASHLMRIVMDRAAPKIQEGSRGHKLPPGSP